MNETAELAAMGNSPDECPPEIFEEMVQTLVVRIQAQAHAAGVAAGRREAWEAICKNCILRRNGRCAAKPIMPFATFESCPLLKREGE